MMLKKTWLSLLCVLGGSTVMAAALNTSVPIIYTADKPNVSVSKEQPEFSLKLKANSTTGYLWFLRDCDASLITPVKHVYEKPETKLIGAPSYDLWTFKMKPAAFVVPRQTVIRMVYARAFSSENMTPVTFTVSSL